MGSNQKNILKFEDIKIGGPTVPMIMLAWNESGKGYLFALNASLKDVWE